MDLLNGSGQRGFTATGAGEWMLVNQQPGYSMEARSLVLETTGGTVGQTVTVEFHSWPDNNTPPVAGDTNTLLGTCTITIGSTYANGITGKDKVPDVSAIPYQFVAAYCTQIGTGGITAYPMMGGV